MRLSRPQPVHFQPLERELEPVVHYLSGRMLNAGCGTRDIRPFLARNGVSDVTLYDIDSTDPSVLIGPLEAMPFEDESFDSALCNAVLEHVEDAGRAMRELARVVREGGYIVVAVPFLQPYHACPGDFRRYTADGLSQLGLSAGLEPVEVLPVHSLAQTLGWIVWEAAREKGGRIRKALAWAFAFLITRLWSHTDRRLMRNANTFQAVFRRPRSSEHTLLANAWRRRPIPTALTRVQTMLVPDELRLLQYLAEEYYSGAGAIIDAGSFLGGSTVAFADGLRRNQRARLPQKPIHAYDRFEVEEWTRGTFFPGDSAAGASFRAEFDRNVVRYSDLIEVHAGDIRDHPWDGGPIEILFIDVAKHWTVCDWVTWQFFPRLIPGRSVVVQQDYLYHHWVAWLHVTMEFYADYFEYVCDTDVNSVVFLNTRKIPDSVLQRRTVESLSVAEKSALMDRAAARFEGRKRELILSAKAHFMEMLQTS